MSAKVLLRECGIEVLGPYEYGNCLVRLTHQPTGRVAAAYGRKRSARAVALAELRRGVAADARAPARPREQDG